MLAVRTLARVLLPLLVGIQARAQQAGGSSAGPSLEPSYETRVTTFVPSPPETQTRLFAGSRFWRLDPGQYEVELWGSLEHSPGQDAFLFQAEIEIGLTPHIQIDLYENLQKQPGAGLAQEGNQLELRYSFASRYGAAWGNPTLYLEWHPREGAPTRAEVRMLLGGQLWLPRLIGAINLYVEQNVFDRTGPTGVDGELGVYASASYGATAHLRLGAEGKLGGDQHGGPSYALSAALGPNAVWTTHHFKATATVFFGLAPKDPRLLPYVILGYQFP